MNLLPILNKIYTYILRSRLDKNILLVVVVVVVLLQAELHESAQLTFIEAPKTNTLREQ